MIWERSGKRALLEIYSSTDPVLLSFQICYWVSLRHRSSVDISLGYVVVIFLTDQVLILFWIFNRIMLRQISCIYGFLEVKQRILISKPLQHSELL